MAVAKTVVMAINFIKKIYKIMVALLFISITIEKMIIIKFEFYLVIKFN